VATTAWKTPGSAAIVTPGFGGTTWSGAANITASDNSYATCALADGANSRYFRLYNFDLGVPAGATLNGIEVEAEGKINTSGSVILSGFLSPDGTGSDDNASFANPLTTTDALYTVNSGNWTDVWGLAGAPSVSDVNSSGFGVLLIGYNEAGASRTISLDQARMRAHYTLTATDASGSIASLTVGVPATSVSGKAAVSATLAGIAVSVAVAVVAAAALVAGSIPGLSVSAPVATVTTYANISPTMPALTYAAPNAAAGVVTLASADLPDASVSAPSVTVSTQANVTADGATVSISAPTAVISQGASVDAAFSAFSISPPVALASIDIEAEAALPSVSMSPAAAIAGILLITPSGRRAIFPESRLSGRRVVL
jgi:hypothetical protein